MNEVVCVLEAGAILGETPVWCPVERRLYWVDIRQPAVHRFDPRTGETWSWGMPEDVGFVVLRQGGGAVVGLRRGFAFLDLTTGTVTKVLDPESDRLENRLNDGKCDRRGRLWAGSVNQSTPRAPTAALYRLDPNLSCQVMARGITTSNSIAWSPDDRTFYFADTPTCQIVAYDFNPAEGMISNPRVFASLPEGTGRPDGSTVDSEGFLWNAHFDGGRITRYAPDGRVDRVIQLPVLHPTSCAFGGDNLGVLYVTTSSHLLSDTERSRNPLAGGLFAVHVGVRGLPEPRFAG